MADSPLPPSGKAPRSEESIRNVLVGLQQNVELPASGSHNQGLAENEPLVIAAFHDPDVAGRFQQRLRREAIMFTARRRGGKTEIVVDFGDRAQAAAVLRLHEQQDPDRPPAAVRRSYDYLIFGALIGAMGGVPIVFGTKALIEGVMAVVTLTLTGGVCGHLLDRLMHRRRKRGLLGIGLIGLMLATAVIAGFVAIGRVLPILLRQ